MWKAGKTYPILYLFAFTYFLQYVFSTYLIYNDYKVLSYQMPINQEKYFGYVLPALGCLFGGMFLFHRDINLRPLLSRIDPMEATRMGYFLLSISYGFDIVKWVGIGSLDSLISFTTYLKYPAVFCFLFTRSRLHKLFIVGVYLQLAFEVVSSGVFISFFIWATFLFFFISLKSGLPYWLRAGVIIVVVPVLVTVQSVKKEYRNLTWNNKQEGGVGVFSDIVEKNNAKTGEEPFENTEGVVRTVGRLSQGWHLGMVLKRVPVKEPIAEGKEMYNDVIASLLPRLIFSGKKSVNSQDKFYQYTGHQLRGSTSMSIGVLGDFYINFGHDGSFVALFVFGALLALLLNFFVRRFVLPNALNLIWIPFMLSYLIRANNDFYIFFNCLVKGFLIFIFINYVKTFSFSGKPLQKTSYLRKSSSATLRKRINYHRPEEAPE